MFATARLLLLSVVLGVLGGCVSWSSDSVREPEVHLLRIQTVKAHLHQQEFTLHLKVVNPTDSRLFIRNLNYRVGLEGLVLAQDDVSLWRSVGAHEERVFKITARTNLWRQIKPLAKLLRRPQALEYRLDGELNTGLVWWRTLQVSRRGEIMPGDLKRSNTQ